MKEETFDFNNFSYNVKINEHRDDFELSLVHNNVLPEFLYKYYAINANSVSALRNGYLFSSHPYQLNDKYDCSADLIDYSNCRLDFYINKLNRETPVFDEDFIRQKFDSDRKWELERAVSNLERDRLFKKFGIISLTKNQKEILMWSYYAQNKGFVIKLETSKLNSNWFGPFPINYSPTISKIDFTMYSPVLALFYQTNVKENIWKHENEWRYLTFNPNGNYNPYYHKNDYHSRFEYYDKSAIRQIILGYDFFEPILIKRNNSFDLLKLKNKMADYKLKRSILNFIISNEIPASHVIRDIRDYSLRVEEMQIKKLGSNTFELKYGEIE